MKWLRWIIIFILALFPIFMLLRGWYPNSLVFENILSGYSGLGALIASMVAILIAERSETDRLKIEITYSSSACKIVVTNLSPYTIYVNSIENHFFLRKKRFHVNLDSNFELRPGQPRVYSKIFFQPESEKNTIVVTLASGKKITEKIN